MKVAIYARVSTTDQNAETQLRPMWSFCQARDWQVYREYVDVGYTGKTAFRPELDLLMRDASALKFKAVMVWKFDRLFRSVHHMLDTLQQFRTLEIQFVSMTEAVDTTTPVGKMVYTMLASVAEFERDLMRERTQAGMARARASGKHIGRPPRLIDLARVAQLQAEHWSLRKISKALKIPLTTLCDALPNPVRKGIESFPNR